MTEDYFITTKELAERWRKSPRTIENMRTRGESPVNYYKLGKTVRYKMSDILLYEESQKNAP